MRPRLFYSVIIMSKIIVAGIDPSLTGTGLVAFRQSTHRPCIRKLLKPSKREHGWDGSDAHRLAIMHESLKLWLKATRPDLAVIEGYAFASRFSRAHALGELGGVFRLALHELGMPFITVPPKTLKLFVLGPRASSAKTAMMKGVASRWGEVFEVSDLADAYGLARVGASLFVDDISAGDAAALNGVELTCVPAAIRSRMVNKGYCNG